MDDMRMITREEASAASRLLYEYGRQQHGDAGLRAKIGRGTSRGKLRARLNQPIARGAEHGRRMALARWAKYRARQAAALAGSPEREKS